jgi:hypothetical protein
MEINNINNNISCSQENNKLSINIDNIDNINNINNKIEKKKRGRKSTNKIIDNNFITYGNNTNIDTNYIAFLPLSYEDINKIKNVNTNIKSNCTSLEIPIQK